MTAFPGSRQPLVLILKLSLAMCLPPCFASPKQSHNLNIPPPCLPTSMQVRLRLPDGGRSQRRFLASSPLSAVFDFVDSLDSTASLRWMGMRKTMAT